MSYDQHQLEAKDTICTKCKKLFYVTNLPTEQIPTWVCFTCRKP
jgi:hypothetical protein